MESSLGSISGILTKISYISNIVVYYGYLHEGARLFRQLCKASRKSWDDNNEAMIKIIMRYKTGRLKIAFNKNLSSTITNWLLRSNNYLYYSISICLEKKNSFKAAEELINKIEYGNDLIFDKIVIKADDTNDSEINQFLELYHSKGFSNENLDINIERLDIINRYLQNGYLDSYKLNYISTLRYNCYYKYWKLSNEGKVLHLLLPRSHPDKTKFEGFIFKELIFKIDFLQSLTDPEILPPNDFCEKIEMDGSYVTNQIPDFDIFIESLNGIASRLTNLKHLSFNEISIDHRGQLLCTLLEK